MATSDSEDFESADEGHGSPEKKERKKRLSSSNNSDNALETEQKPLNTKTSSKDDQKLVENVKETDGWDDFDIEDAAPIAPQPDAKSNVPEKIQNKPEVKPSVTKQSPKSQDTGWDEFNDWGSGAVNADELFDDWGTEGATADVQKDDGWATQDACADVQKFGTWGTEIAAGKLDDWGTEDACADEKVVDWGTKLADEKFGDWEPEDVCADEKFYELPKPREVRPRPITRQPEPNIKEVTDRMAAASAGSGWGWGWTVDSLLSSATAGFSSATAGISNITSQVSQGISTALESGIGAPDPEELARRTSTKDNDTRVTKPENVPAADKITVVASEEVGANAGGNAGANSGAIAGANTGDNAGEAFQFGSLFSGVTKFVETTGTKVIHGGLDTLETIGKKTMEVLQDGDPGLAKKRALLGLGAGDKPVLSQVLREAKAKAEEDDRVREEKREAKEVHYENLFDDYEGLVHLEALEMLSKQVSMRIEERIRSVDADKRQDIKETLQQVAELCEMPEEDEEDEESPSEDLSKSDAFHERLQSATQDLGLKLQFQPLVKQYKEILDYISTLDSEASVKAVYKRGVSTLAQSTALSVEQYHKAAEMVLVKARRSTADEADALTQMTVVLTKHISELATLFTEKLNALPSDNKEQVNTYITNIFLEAGNSSTYIQNAFQLALPILQIGAV